MHSGISFGLSAPDRFQLDALVANRNLQQKHVWLFAALDVLGSKMTGRCMQRHRHQEFFRSLNVADAAVPAGKVLHAILEQLRRSQAPEGPYPARPTPALDLPLHAYLR